MAEPEIAGVQLNVKNGEIRYLHRENVDSFGERWNAARWRRALLRVEFVFMIKPASEGTGQVRGGAHAAFGGD